MTLEVKTIRTLLIVASISLIGCGQNLSEEKDRETKDEGKKSETDPNPASEITTANFRGYVVSAFEVTVDGNKFKDLEDYYTQEVTRLPERLADLGYEATGPVRFEAELGFADLWNNMVVYIVAGTTRGYQGQTQVSRGGEFTIPLPPDAHGDEYKVRAVKRISVVIPQAGSTERICFNFSAVDQSVSFADRDKPIILSNFVSGLTKYDCPQIANNGLPLPNASAGTASSSLSGSKLLTKGMTRDDVRRILDTTNLAVSGKKWCFFAQTGTSAPQCAVNFTSACQCSLTFDEDGRLMSLDNIQSRLLDLNSW